MRSNVGPFFCGADVTIYLGLEFARAVWGYVGDMALVQVVAHEFGHSLQQLLGLAPVAGSPAFELQADCLGGAYAQDAAARGLLEPGDAEEARYLSRLVGDDGPSDDPHGSPDEREQAWLAGFGGGLALPRRLTAMVSAVDQPARCPLVGASARTSAPGRTRLAGKAGVRPAQPGQRGALVGPADQEEDRRRPVRRPAG